MSSLQDQVQIAQYRKSEKGTSNKSVPEMAIDIWMLTFIGAILMEDPWHSIFLAAPWIYMDYIGLYHIWLCLKIGDYTVIIHVVYSQKKDD